ncbi:MAG: response regulator [Sutterellaceae bacterium]|nr:response regulator [Sutterellaceae bacterium]
MTEELKKKVCIRIVDDELQVRESLGFMLECNRWNVVLYGSAQEFLDNDDATVPGCLLLDIRMPEMSGVELQRYMKENRNRLPIIFITGHADVDTAIQTLKMGALDFLKKPVDYETLEPAIVNAARIHEAQLAGRLTPEAVNQVFEEMSPREKEITKLILAGVLNKNMAERYGISERTVQGHRNNIYRKLRVHNLQELLEQVKGADRGLLS